jgi:hypothetical protein
MYLQTHIHAYTQERMHRDDIREMTSLSVEKEAMVLALVQVVTRPHPICKYMMYMYAKI